MSTELTNFDVFAIPMLMFVDHLKSEERNLLVCAEYYSEQSLVHILCEVLHKVVYRAFCELSHVFAVLKAILSGDMPHNRMKIDINLRVCLSHDMIPNG